MKIEKLCCKGGWIMRFIGKWAIFFAIVTSCVMPRMFSEPVQSQIEKSDNGKIELLLPDNGLEAWFLFKESIKAAEKSIECSPCMTGGNCLYQLLDLFELRMTEKPELIIHMMIQPTMSDSKDFAELRRLKLAFPDRFHYVLSEPVPTRLPKINVMETHFKASVVDGKYFFFGGTNYEDFMCNTGDCIPEEDHSPRRYLYFERALAFRDQDIIGKSTRVAEEIRRVFYGLFAVWERYSETRAFIKDPLEIACEYTPLPSNDTCLQAFDSNPAKITVDNSKVRFIFSGPHNSQNNPIGRAYRELIDNAVSSIFIGNLYFLPVKPIFSSLLNATDRGVTLNIITNGSHDRSPAVTEVYVPGNRIHYLPLLYGRELQLWDYNKLAKLQRKNVSVYEYYLYQTQYHKKVMVVDNRYFLIGSYNLGMKSEYYDYEAVIIIDSEIVASRALRILEKDKSLSMIVPQAKFVDWFFDIKTHFLGQALVNFMPG